MTSVVCWLYTGGVPRRKEPDTWRSHLPGGDNAPAHAVGLVLRLANEAWALCSQEAGPPGLANGEPACSGWSLRSSRGSRGGAAETPPAHGSADSVPGLFVPDGHPSLVRVGQEGPSIGKIAAATLGRGRIACSHDGGGRCSGKGGPHRPCGGCEKVPYTS